MKHWKILRDRRREPGIRHDGQDALDDTGKTCRKGCHKDMCDVRRIPGADFGCGVARAGHGERAELLVQLGVVAVTGLPNLRLPRVVS
jgi:hypothetical protein